MYSFGELLDMLGRVLARSQHRNACTSSCLRKGLMDNQDSEIAHLKFVACVFFFEAVLRGRTLPCRGGCQTGRVGM